MGLCHSDSQYSIVSLRGGGYTTSTFQGLHKRCCGSGHKNSWGEEEGRGESAYETRGRRPPSAFECFGRLCGASRGSRVVVDTVAMPGKNELTGIGQCVTRVAQAQLKGTTWSAALIKDNKNPAALAFGAMDGGMAPWR